MSQNELQQQLLRDAGALLRFQGELGLAGLDVADTTLKIPIGPELHQGDPSESPSSVAALEIVAADLGACERCKLSRGRTHIVFGIGAANARLMFIGEGPGYEEDKQGEPFVGPAGQLLDKMIAAMGLSRQEVYIANVVKCRPPKNRDPEPDEVAACEPFLKRQIDAVAPEAIVALGRCATQTLLRTGTAISRLRGRWHRYHGIDLMPTFHPAFLLRDPGQKRAAWQDLQSVMVKLGLQDPRQRS